LRGQTLDAIHAHGAELVAIGNGTPAQARAFREEFRLPFPLYTDPGRESYSAAGLESGILASLRPSLALNGLRAMRQGHRQGSLQGSPLQQGGALVIDRGGRLLYRFVSGTGGDHPDPAQLVGALGCAEGARAAADA